MQEILVMILTIFSVTYIEGIHYKKLSFEDRSVDLDRLEGPPDHIVTGVRFRMLGSHINLEVSRINNLWLSGLSMVKH